MGKLDLWVCVSDKDVVWLGKVGFSSFLGRPLLGSFCVYRQWRCIEKIRVLKESYVLRRYYGRVLVESIVLQDLSKILLLDSIHKYRLAQLDFGFLSSKRVLNE